MEQEAGAVLQKGALQSLTWQRGAIALGAMLGFFLAAKLAGHLVRRSFSKRGKAGGATFALSKLLTYALVVAGVPDGPRPSGDSARLR